MNQYQSRQLRCCCYQHFGSGLAAAGRNENAPGERESDADRTKTRCLPEEEESDPPVFEECDEPKLRSVGRQEKAHRRTQSAWVGGWMYGGCRHSVIFRSMGVCDGETTIRRDGSGKLRSMNLVAVPRPALFPGSSNSRAISRDPSETMWATRRAHCWFDEHRNRAPRI